MPEQEKARENTKSASLRESRRFVRELMAGAPYYECYVKCSLEACEARDPKGLYRRARKGQIANMTGIGDPYETPKTPDFTVETDRCSLGLCVEAVIQFLVDIKMIVPRRL